jgi:hypothetical protein
VIQYEWVHKCGCDGDIDSGSNPDGSPGIQVVVTCNPDQTIVMIVVISGMKGCHDRKLPIK